MNDKEFYKQKYRDRYKPTPKSAFVKMAVFRVISSGSTALIVYFITGSLGASKIMFWIDLCFKSVLYYVYEFQWARIMKWWDKRRKVKTP